MHQSQARSDCTFVYLTHDLRFAANRIGATKVCLTDYTDGAFSWFAVAAQRDIPEDVYLEVLGSRKPVLFIEGTSGSHDFEIYQMAYPSRLSLLEDAPPWRLQRRRSGLSAIKQGAINPEALHSLMDQSMRNQG
jgi:hypothetical protein